MTQNNESTATESQEAWNAFNDKMMRDIEDAEATESCDLMFDLQLQTHKTIDLLGLLSDTVLNYAESYAENSKDPDAQRTFYALAAIFADRKAVLEALTDRF